MPPMLAPGPPRERQPRRPAEWTGPLCTAQRFAERRRTGTQHSQQRLLVPGRLRRGRPDHAAQLLNSAGCGMARRDPGWGQVTGTSSPQVAAGEVAAAGHRPAPGQAIALPGRTSSAREGAVAEVDEFLRPPAGHASLADVYQPRDGIRLSIENRTLDR
jgi:hypothetical protein